MSDSPSTAVPGTGPQAGSDLLFDPGEAPAGPAPGPAGAPRLRHARRDQVEMRVCSLDSLIPDDHPTRAVWDYVAQLDLSGLLGKVKALAGQPGKPATDPRLLLALWLYATLRGIGSARELARRCDPEIGEVPFQWICGGVSVNYHTLSDFRVGHGEVLDGLLTGSVAVLLEQGLVVLERVAQDGLKVRASAGAASFRRRPRLEELQEQARQQVEALQGELAADPGAATRRQQAARRRAAEDRAERLRRALEQLPQAEAAKAAGERGKARVSTTDPEARVMKMGDGGFRPAYNAQLATDTQTQIITGVDVTNAGSDQGQLAPMVEQHEQRYGERPRGALVDGGFTKKDDITAVEKAGTTVYAPVPTPKDPARDPHAPLPSDTPEVGAWRQRMGTPEAKGIYKERASTAECVNAQARNRGLYQLRVRGLAKAKAVLLLYALAHNLMRVAALRAARAAEGG